MKGRKVRLTYVFTVNADGSEKEEPLVIGKAKQPRAFRKKTGAQLGFMYRNNAKAWMTAVLYQQWLHEWDVRLQLANRKIVLLQDNFSGHIVPDDLENIQVINFAPNLTSHIQPLDQGIIRCFKAHYRKLYIERAIERYESGITPAEIYDINQLEAMRLAQHAWAEVDTDTIRHCWRKAAILPDCLHPNTPLPQPSISIASLLASETNPLTHVEAELNNAIDSLEAIGVLHRVNRMSIELLLNSNEEAIGVDGISDGDICEAVLKSRRAQEVSEINGGDDDVDDDASPDELTVPTSRRALEAATLLKKYLGTTCRTYSRPLEGMLSQLSRDICKERNERLRDTSLLDYFAPKTT